MLFIYPKLAKQKVKMTEKIGSPMWNINPLSTASWPILLHCSRLSISTWLPVFLPISYRIMIELCYHQLILVLNKSGTKEILLLKSKSMLTFSPFKANNANLTQFEPPYTKSVCSTLCVPTTCVPITILHGSSVSDLFVWLLHVSLLHGPSVTLFVSLLLVWPK